MTKCVLTNPANRIRSRNIGCEVTRRVIAQRGQVDFNFPENRFYLLGAVNRLIVVVKGKWKVIIQQVFEKSMKIKESFLRVFFEKFSLLSLYRLPTEHVIFLM